MKKLYFAVLILLASLVGCVSGKATYFTPSTDPTSAESANAYPFECGSTRIWPNAIQLSGAQVLHYIVPLWVMLPETETESDIEFEILLFSKDEMPSSILAKDLYINTNESNENIFPYKTKVSSSVNYQDNYSYKKSIKLFFSKNRNEVENFRVVFKENLFGCSLPDIYYQRDTDTHLSTPFNK